MTDLVLTDQQMQAEVDARSVVIETRWAQIGPRLDEIEIRHATISAILAKAPKETPLDARLIAHGIIHPIFTQRAAAKVGCSLAVIAASLTMESGDRNVFGSDPVSNPISGRTHTYVTKGLYDEYLRYRNEGMGCQGVGPGQLTSASLQDTCDRVMGGTWNIEPNTQMDALFLKQLIDEYHSVELGFQHYNGAGPAAVAYGERALSLYEMFIHDGIN